MKRAAPATGPPFFRILTRAAVGDTLNRRFGGEVMNPVKRATKTKQRWTAWFAAVSVWALVGLVGVHSYALDLGAAHHDMFCDAH